VDLEENSNWGCEDLHAPGAAGTAVTMPSILKPKEKSLMMDQPRDTFRRAMIVIQRRHRRDKGKGRHVRAIQALRWPEGRCGDLPISTKFTGAGDKDAQRHR